MRVAIRVDLSVPMGLGHARRCQSLAFALRDSGAQILFVSRPMDLDSRAVLSRPFYDVRLLERPAGAYERIDQAAPQHASWAGVSWEQDANDTIAALRGWQPDWLVIDHYSFDSRWHTSVRHALGCRILVVDDLADRDLDADILVDHNWCDDHRLKYGSHATRVSRLLGGPRFALLGPDYATTQPYSFRPEVESIGIFMGGTDAARLSETALAACRRIAGFSGTIEVATTSSNPNLRRLRECCAVSPGTTLLVDQPSLAGFFARHDLQIGAGGGATWERCCMGAPSIAVIGAANQVPVLRPLSGLGVLLAVESENANAPMLAGYVGELIESPATRHDLGVSARNMVDGLGSTRVAQEVGGRC